MRIEHYDKADAHRVLLNVMVPLYEAAYVHVLDDPFYATEIFIERKHENLLNPGVTLVVAYDGNEAVGLAFGYPLPADRRWWEVVDTPVANEVTQKRTFAFNELMVAPRWQRQGIGGRLHDHLLRGRPEEQARLAVKVENTAAQAAYKRWGWTTLGTRQPTPSEPRVDTMVIPLPLREKSR